MGANGVAPTAPTAVRERVHHRQRRVGDTERLDAGVVVVVRRRYRRDDGGERRRRFVFLRGPFRRVTPEPSPPVPAPAPAAVWLAGSTVRSSTSAAAAAEFEIIRVDDFEPKPPAVPPAVPPSSSRNAVNASVAASSLATTSARSLSPGGGVRLVSALAGSCARAAASANAVLANEAFQFRSKLLFRRFWTFLDGTRHRSSTPSPAHATNTPRPSIAGDAATQRARNSQAAVAVAQPPEAAEAAKTAQTFSSSGPGDRHGFDPKPRDGAHPATRPRTVDRRASPPRSQRRRRCPRRYPSAPARTPAATTPAISGAAPTDPAPMAAGIPASCGGGARGATEAGTARRGAPHSSRTCAAVHGSASTAADRIDRTPAIPGWWGAREPRAAS